MHAQQSRPGTGRMSAPAARRKPRPLTAAQERLFLAALFSLGLLLQLAAILQASLLP